MEEVSTQIFSQKSAVLGRFLTPHTLPQLAMLVDPNLLSLFSYVERVSAISEEVEILPHGVTYRDLPSITPFLYKKDLASIAKIYQYVPNHFCNLGEIREQSVGSVAYSKVMDDFVQDFCSWNFTRTKQYFSLRSTGYSLTKELINILDTFVDVARVCDGRHDDAILSSSVNATAYALKHCGINSPTQSVAVRCPSALYPFVSLLLATKNEKEQRSLSCFFHHFLAHYNRQKGAEARDKLYNEKIIINGHPVGFGTLLLRLSKIDDPVEVINSKLALSIPGLMRAARAEQRVEAPINVPEAPLPSAPEAPAEQRVEAPINAPEAPPPSAPEAPAAKPAAAIAPYRSQPLSPTALSQIAMGLEAHWSKNPAAHRAFLSALKEQRGRWSTSIDDPALKKHVLTPLVEMLRNATPAHRPAVLELVRDIVTFMHLHSRAAQSNPNVVGRYKRLESLNDNELEQIVLHHTLLPSRETGELSSIQTNEVLETLFSAKMHELRLRVEANKLNRKEEAIESFPAFLSHNNLDKAHLEILSAQFVDGSLVGFAQPTPAAFGLLERARIGSTRTADRVEANATAEQLTSLKTEIAHRETPGYIFARLQYRAQMPASAPHQEPAVTEEDTAAPVQEEAPPPPRPKSSRPETTIDREEEALRKRLKGKEEVEEMEIDASSLIGPPPTPSSLPGSSMNRGDGKQKPYVLAPTGKFQQASHEPAPKPKPQVEPRLGEILPVANPMGDRSLSSKESAPVFTLDNLWTALSNEAAEKTIEKIRLEAEKAATARKGRLTIPRYGDLKAAEDAPATPLPMLNRLLKDYQKQDLDELFHYSASGFSKLLCYEMGVGKTFVYGSAILHRLYTGRKGHVLVATPASIKESINADLKVILREGVLTAWEVFLSKSSGRWNRQDRINGYLLPKLQSKNSDDAKLGIMMLGRLSAEEREAFFTWLQHQKGGNRVAAKVLSGQFIDEHLKAAELFLHNLREKLHSLPDKRAQVEEALKRLGSARSTNNLQERLSIAGQLLAFHPDREPIPQNASFDIDGIDRLLNFSFNVLKVREKGNQIHEAIASPTDFSVTVLSHIGLQKLKSYPQLDNVGAIVIDEMHKLENAQSGRTADVRTIVSRLPKAQIIGVSGTPMENNFEELVTLISLVNPTLIDEKTVAIFRGLLTAASDAMQIDDESKAQKAVMTAFARITAFNESVLQPLLLRRMQEDEVVRNAWNDLITTLTHEEQPFSITDRVSAAYDSIFGSTTNALERDSKFNRIFLDPSLKDVTHFETNNPEVQDYLRRIKSSTDEAFHNLTNNSPYLNWVINSPHLQQALAADEKVLIFAKHTAVVQATVEALRKKGIQAEPYCGDDSLAPVNRFKSTPGARVLVTTYDKGGTGLNLNEADVVMLLQEEYNPGKLSQAIFRIKRVGTKKTVTVVRPENEELYPLQHMKSILKNKELLFQFLFHQFPSRLEQYAHWLELLKGRIYNAQLNHLGGNVAATNEKIEGVDARILEFLSATDEQQLKAEIEAVRPREEPQPLPPAPQSVEETPARRKRPPSPSLSVTAAKTQRQSQSQLAPTAPNVKPTFRPGVDLPGGDYQKLPIPGAQMEDAIRASIALSKDPELAEDGKLISNMLKGYRRHPSHRSLVRGRDQRLPDDVKSLVDAFEEKSPNLQLWQALLDYKIEIYTYEGNGNFYKLSQRLSEDGPAIRLLETKPPNQESYYDVLVYKPWQ